MLAPDSGGEHRPKPVRPELRRLVADLDAALVQQVHDVSQRQRVADIKHHRQADDLGACLEVPEGAGFGHREKPGGRPDRLDQSSFAAAAASGMAYC